MKSGGSPATAEALRQQLAKGGRQAMAIHQGLDLGAQGGLGTRRRKRKPASELKQQLSEHDTNGLKRKKKKNESEEKNERERDKERKRRQRREVKGKDKMTESEEERERGKEKKRRERQAEKEREEEEEMAMMLALAVPDVEYDPSPDRASPQPAPAFDFAEVEAAQAPLTREAELERRLKEDHDMIQRLKQELDQARAAAEEARRVAREESEMQAAAQEAAAGGEGGVSGGAAMSMEWATEVLMDSDLPSITDLVNQPELISDFLSMDEPPLIPPTTALPPSFPSPSSSASSSSASLHASPIPGAANPAFGIWPAPPKAWGRGHSAVGRTHSPGSPLTAATSPTFPPGSTRLPQYRPHRVAPVKRVDVLLPFPAPPPHSDQIRWRRTAFGLADDQETVASLRNRALASWHRKHANGCPSSNEEEIEAAAQAAADREQEDWVLTSHDSIPELETSVRALLHYTGPTAKLYLRRK